MNFENMIEDGVKIFADNRSKNLMPHFIYYGSDLSKLKKIFLNKMKQYRIKASIVTAITSKMCHSDERRHHLKTEEMIQQTSLVFEVLQNSKEDFFGPKLTKREMKLVERNYKHFRASIEELTDDDVNNEVKSIEGGFSRETTVINLSDQQYNVISDDENSDRSKAQIKNAFIFVATLSRDTSSYEPEKLLSILMNTIAIDESDANEIIGFYKAQKQNDNIIEKLRRKSYFGVGKCSHLVSLCIFFKIIILMSPSDKLHIVMTKGLFDDSKAIRNDESAVLRCLSKKNLQYCSLTLLAMSRIHLITKEEVDRIYKGVSRYARGGLFYGHESLNDDIEEFSDSLTKCSIRNETKELYFLPKCKKSHSEGISTDTKRLKLYYDFNFFGKNPDVPKELMELSLVKSRYCFALASRQTRIFHFR